MVWLFEQKKLLSYEPDEKNDDATSGRDHEDKSKSLVWRTNPHEGQIRCGTCRRRLLDRLSVFVFQGNISYDAADVERKGGDGVLIAFA